MISLPPSDWNDGEGGRIPLYMLPGLTRYINEGLQPGGFLEAVLANDLHLATKRGDAQNLFNLRAYTNFLLEFAPAASFGSYARVVAWVEHRGLAGLPNPSAPT